MGKKKEQGVVVEYVKIEDGELVSCQDAWGGCGYTLTVTEDGALWLAEDSFDDDMAVAVYAANVWKSAYHTGVEWGSDV